MIFIQSATGISRPRPQEQTCTETAITNGMKLVPSVSTATLKGTRESQPTKWIKDLYLSYRSLTLSLSSLSQNNNQPPPPTTTNEATANGTADTSTSILWRHKGSASAEVVL